MEIVSIQTYGWPPAIPLLIRSSPTSWYRIMAVRLVNTKAGAVTIEITGHLHEDEYLIINPVKEGPFVLVIKPNYDLDASDTNYPASLGYSQSQDDQWMLQCIGQSPGTQTCQDGGDRTPTHLRSVLVPTSNGQLAVPDDNSPSKSSGTSKTESDDTECLNGIINSPTRHPIDRKFATYQLQERRREKGTLQPGVREITPPPWSHIQLPPEHDASI